MTQLLTAANNFFFKLLRCSIKKNKVFLPLPPYVNRHKGKNFLILASGPSLKKYKPEILNFIDRYQPIIMGCNFLGDMFVPHYHAIINQKMFQKYVNTIHRDSKILLSPYWTRLFINSYSVRNYELISYENNYPGNKGNMQILNGIIYAEGVTVGAILIGVAIIMGAKNIFVAGLDGYLLNDATHFYEKFCEVALDKYILLDQRAIEVVNCCQKILKNHNGGEIIVLTPTIHEEHYEPINSFFKT